MIHAYLPAEDGSNTYGAAPPELTLRVRKHKAIARWGYHSAQIDVTGPEHAVWAVLEWLRRPVVLVNDSGAQVWAGFVYEAEVQSGNLRVGASLEQMANRVSVAYALRTPTGFERQTTDPLNDEPSQYRYGIKESLISIGEATEERAAAKATEVLAASANPPKLPTFGGGTSDRAAGLAATLYCVGWSNLLAWRTYARSGARVAHEGKTGKTQAIGWQLVSSDVVFSRKTGLVDFFARLGGLEPGLTIAVSGSTANNRTFVLSQTQSGERFAYTANTIYFDPSDDIYDAAQGFEFIEVWSIVRISGSASNNGFFEVDGKASNGYFTVTGGSVVAESAGASVTIEQGASTLLSPAPAIEYSTGTKTVTLYGYRLAQAFVASDTLSMREVSVMAAVVGAPGDALRVALHADSAGQPGTMLGASSYGAGDLPEDDPAWVTFTFSPFVPLTNGQTYWIVVERTGALSPTDYFAVKTSPDAAGVCLAWTGSVWLANPTGETLLHIVQSVQETTEQIRAMATASGAVTATVVEEASNIFDSPDREGDMSVYDEIDKLLAVGQSGGRRLLAAIDAGRNLRVFAAPLQPSESELPVYTLRGQIVTATGGQPVAEGVLPVGEWLAIERAPRHLDLSPIFVEEAEYNASSGMYQITPERSR
jgi:hypothetical protein